MIIPIIAGPTGVGKTNLSITLAKEINASIISADSMQIYKGMDIGTAKIKEEEKEGIKHYLIDIVDPKEKYSVKNFKDDFLKIKEEIKSEGKNIIIVGGTGLYINSIIYDLTFFESNDPEFRKKKEEEVRKNPEAITKLYKELKKIDPEYAEKISESDEKRIIRALEIYKTTGKTKTYMDKIQKDSKRDKDDYLLFILNMPRQKLYNRINTRVDKMLEEGLVEEVKRLQGRLSKTSAQAIGYKEMLEYLSNEISYDEMVEKIKKRSRNYAKRQLTWFRKNDGLWIDLSEKTVEEAKDIIIDSLEKAEN